MPLLVCPVCRHSLSYVADDPAGLDGILRHGGGTCAEAYPVIDEIPRLLLGPGRASLVRSRHDWFAADPVRRVVAERWSSADKAEDQVVTDFDFEWARFSEVGTSELHRVFLMYFDLLEPSAFRPDSIVLDAGCGAGRWALEVARAGPRVIAVDLGRSVELAHRSTKDTGLVGCVQADIRELPLAPGSVDWAYSLGVLHHVEGPERAVAGIAEALRPGGRLLIYLYYALEGRGSLFRSLFRMVDRVRSRTSRLPRPAVRRLSWVAAALVYFPLARLSAVLSRLGMRRLAAAIPLSFYAERSFSIMLNDSLDRFGTSVEHRYTREQLTQLLHGGGLGEVRFSAGPPYWHAIARTAAPAPEEER